MCRDFQSLAGVDVKTRGHGIWLALASTPACNVLAGIRHFSLTAAWLPAPRATNQPLEADMRTGYASYGLTRASARIARRQRTAPADVQNSIPYSLQSSRAKWTELLRSGSSISSQAFQMPSVILFCQYWLLSWETRVEGSQLHS